MSLVPKETPSPSSTDRISDRIPSSQLLKTGNIIPSVQSATEMASTSAFHSVTTIINDIATMYGNFIFVIHPQHHLNAYCNANSKEQVTTHSGNHRRHIRECRLAVRS